MDVGSERRELVEQAVEKGTYLSQHQTAVVDGLIRRTEAAVGISAFEILKTFLDTGMLHHYFCARLSLCPTIKQQAEWLDEYFKRIYTSRQSLIAELSDLTGSSDSEADELAAYRLLNLSTYSGPFTTEIQIRVVALFPDLLTPYAIGLWFSEFECEVICRYITPYLELGNKDINSIYTLCILEKNESALRYQQTKDIVLESNVEGLAKIYNDYLKLLIAKSKRNSEDVLSAFSRLIANAPGFSRAYATLTGLSLEFTFPSSLEVYGLTHGELNVGHYKGFLKPLAVNLNNQVFTTKSFPLTVVYLIREVSEFSEIIPYEIRNTIKRAAAHLFLKAGQFEEWRKGCEPLLAEAIERSNIFDRLDPFALELFVEEVIDKIANNAIVSSSRTQQLQFIWMCGPSPVANRRIGQHLCDILKTQGLNAKFIGYSNILQSIAYTFASTENKSIFGTADSWLDYKDEITQFIDEQIHSLLADYQKDSRDILIMCEPTALYWLPLHGQLLERSAILQLEPPTEEVLYCALHELYGYKVSYGITPTLADTVFHERLRVKLIEVIQEQSPMFFRYEIATHEGLGVLDWHQFLTESQLIAAEQCASALAMCNQSQSGGMPASSSDNISTRLGNNADYQQWLIDNKDDLDLLKTPWQPL